MKRLLAFSLVLCVQSFPAFAGVVKLANGDRLTGELKSLENGKLTVSTSYAGNVAITWSQVQEISSDGPLMARLVSGVEVTGVLASPEPGVLEVSREQGPVRTSFAEVVALIPPAQAPVEPNLLQGWHGGADLGYTLTRGNTDVTNFSFAVAPERRTSTDRMIASFQALHNTQNGTTANNLYKARFRYERFLSPRTFAFGQGAFEKDERENLDLRTSEGGGFGFRWRSQAGTQLAIFGGVTFLQEKFTGLERNLEAEGLAGFEFETLRLKPLVLTTRTQYLPILTDGRYRLEWEGGVRLPLLSAFTVGFQLFDNYDSAPPSSGVQENDFGLVSTFGWTF